ncbi:hypothetical protein [Pseudobacillus wudalianchiensis]|uniref:hypothetical protein n=1 Tax=Pseudobacillus wudalianchiensis TaxID=1743143 RepID=UPI00159F1588|nr:hypothetical protein [Bacillus wudalianchiensis]
MDLEGPALDLEDLGLDTAILIIHIDRTHIHHTLITRTQRTHIRHTLIIRTHHIHILIIKRKGKDSSLKKGRPLIIGLTEKQLI